MKDFLRILIVSILAILAVGAIAIGMVTVASAEEGYDLRTVSRLTAEELAPFMHPESRHLADEVIEICAKEGISAEFIATVMRWERRPDLHNWFGWTNNRGRLMRFATDEQCLRIIIPRIKKMYLTENGCYFNGYTVAAVSKCYNNTDFWRNTITAGTNKILNKGGK